jgi:predicted RNA binding protein YcfA (HicA-like mRNA interferase family)
VPPRLGEVRKVLNANGFECVRARKHEVWTRRSSSGGLEAKTVVSHGNAEIRTRGLFAKILRQSMKTEEEFYERLREG